MLPWETSVSPQCVMARYDDEEELDDFEEDEKLDEDLDDDDDDDGDDEYEDYDDVEDDLDGDEEPRHGRRGDKWE